MPKTISISNNTRRLLISISSDLENQIRNGKAAGGDKRPFAAFLVHLLKLGLEQYDADTEANLDDGEPETEPQHEC